jgi:imidazolonepropionase-like amidohydrolase
VRAGVRLVLGPDAGIAPHKPHNVLPYAVADLTQAMSNSAALSAATYHAAVACNLADRKGRLTAGFDADIIAVDGDPTADISAIHRQIATYHRGVPRHQRAGRPPIPGQAPRPRPAEPDRSRDHS